MGLEKWNACLKVFFRQALLQKLFILQSMVEIRAIYPPSRWLKECGFTRSW